MDLEQTDRPSLSIQYGRNVITLLSESAAPVPFQFHVQTRLRIPQNSISSNLRLEFQGPTTANLAELVEWKLILRNTGKIALPNVVVELGAPAVLLRQVARPVRRTFRHSGPGGVSYMAVVPQARKASLNTRIPWSWSFSPAPCLGSARAARTTSIRTRCR